MMQGCKVDKAPDWTPSYLTPEEAEQVAAMAETILPKTDTPGAKDVFVDRYIDLVAQDCLEPEEQAKFFIDHVVLERVVAQSRAAGALVLLDVKRGDIGSTSQAYADAYLDPASPLGCTAAASAPSSTSTSPPPRPAAWEGPPTSTRARAS